MELEGRIAVVTGGGSGIGAALCVAAAEAGMDVAVADIELEAAEAVADEVRKTGRRALALAVDVTQLASVEAAARRCDEALGGCDLLCNNAGVLVVGNLLERTDEDWQWVWSVNVLGPFHGARAFAPGMIERGRGGHIVNTCSSNALFTLPHNGVYAASKYAALGLTETLRLELAPHGIGVSALCPGGVATRIMHSQRNRPSELGESKPKREDLIELMNAGDEANAQMIDPAIVAGLVLEGVRRNDPWIITHPGSRETVARRVEGLLAAYDRARQEHPDLP